MDNNENKQKKSEVALDEEKVLAFWKDNNIFKKSEEKEAPNGEFIFYDGPPFANGPPHYGHILAGILKDVIPRYQVMKGKKVDRQWGWDCHGLPVENLVEEELGLKSKQDIVEHGIEKFNQAAKDSVLRYDKVWKEVIPRTGRWVDMENSYQTMDTNYSESIWWIFKNIYDKGLIYEGNKSMHLCPRCETTLSNFEVNQGYKDITDISVTAKFELVDEPGTFVLAWTTTPWTLPGNVALAVGEDVDYVKVVVDEKSDETETNSKEGSVLDNAHTIKFSKFIVAKDLAETIMGKKAYDIEEEFKGKDLIGKAYKPVFDFYKDVDLENKENGWKIYGADFVTTKDGTGVVHIAPAFGDDDMQLGQKENLPFIQHVSVNGKFTEEINDPELKGRYVKPKDDHMSTDIEIIKNLANRPEGSLLFAKEKLIHSYPHCWRCDTPLLNYATSSWFLKVTDIKDKLIKVNQDINWVPTNIRDGRFGKWLEGARDWAISRTRFWGAPLPVWKCEDCENIEVLGSIDDLKQKTKSTNNYFVMRHGEAENNTLRVFSSSDTTIHPLTEKGREQVSKSASELKDKGIDMIIASPFLRTKQTAEIVAKELGIEKVQFADELGEHKAGEFEKLSYDKLKDLTYSLEDRFKVKLGGESGENFTDVRKRAVGFLEKTDKEYSGKTILFVTHERTDWMLITGAQFMNPKKSIAWLDQDEGVVNAEWHKLDYAPLPHNKNYEVDLHMPYIDRVEITCSCGGQMKRIEEVFDCWFESGAMPYASNHYPFENLDKFNPEKNIGFPANFIAEGLDQTRGWFYTSLVLSTALFGKTSFENVIVNGMILAEDGKKMSKRLKNYPEPAYVFDKYGADALRYYLMNSPVVRAEDMDFMEKGVDEVLKKIILRIKNVISFYELYNSDLEMEVIPEDSPSILDQWILSRMNQLIEEVSKGLDNYELDRASRPIMDFVDDLSTWYIRRSRDRVKGDNQFDKDCTLVTIREVLLSLSKTIAPFMPFLAEEIYQKLRTDADKESVHLEDWLETGKVNIDLIEDMEELRGVVSIGLEARAEAGIKVRQPLGGIKIKARKWKVDEKQIVMIIKEEMNVKEVVFDEKLEKDVELDLNLTPELIQEGQYRELLRNIQRMRKDFGLVPSDVIGLSIETSKEGEEIVTKFELEIKKVAGIKEIKFEIVSDGDEVRVDEIEFKIKIDK